MHHNLFILFFDRTNAMATENRKQYKYTLSSNNGLMSSEQRNFYEENGFIVINRLINETLLDQFK